MNTDSSSGYGLLTANYPDQAAAIVPRTSLDNVSLGGTLPSTTSWEYRDDAGKQRAAAANDVGDYIKGTSKNHLNYFWPLSYQEYRALNNGSIKGAAGYIGSSFGEYVWLRTAVWSDDMRCAEGFQVEYDGYLTRYWFSNYGRMRPAVYLDLNDLSASGLTQADQDKLAAIKTHASDFALDATTSVSPATTTGVTGSTVLASAQDITVSLGGADWYVVGACGWGVGQQSIGDMNAPAGTPIGTVAGVQGSAAGYAPNTATLVRAAFSYSADTGSYLFNDEYRSSGDTKYPYFTSDNVEDAGAFAGSGPVLTYQQSYNGIPLSAAYTSGTIGICQSSAAFSGYFYAKPGATAPTPLVGGTYHIWYLPAGKQASNAAPSDWHYTGRTIDLTASTPATVDLACARVSYRSAFDNAHLPKRAYVVKDTPYSLVANTLSRPDYTANGWVAASAGVASDQEGATPAATAVASVKADLGFWANWTKNRSKVVAPTLESLATPAAVVMGGPGATPTPANVGQGARLGLKAPDVLSSGGAPIVDQGWQIHERGRWVTFNPNSYMSLSHHGKKLRYYASNKVHTTHSNQVTISVKANPLYPTLGGKDRIATSAQTALNAWPEGSRYAVLAAGNDFKGALAASYLAGHLDAPVLLVSPQLKNNAPIKAALKTLKVSKVYVVGASVTTAMASSVGFASYTRVSKGSDGATEAADVVRYATSTLHKSKPASILLTTTTIFPDALGASAYAANPRLNTPILFVQGKDDAAKAVSLVKALGSVKTVYALGSTKVVSAQAVAQVKAAAKKAKSVRLWGADRNLTAAAVFATFAPKVAALNASKHLDSVGIAVGMDFPDALGAGAAQARLGGAVMITPPTKVGVGVKKVLTGGTFKCGNTTYRVSALHKHLVDFCFYGKTMTPALKKTISAFIR
jgi:putative cell wall-binding protein